MRTMRWTLMAVMAATSVGCGSVVLQPGPPGDAAAPDAAGPDAIPADVPRACRSSADCSAGEECLIREGCDVPSYCGPQLGRPCTDDLAVFCGCDGQTFTGSSTCPPRVYARRGPCESADGGPAGCVLPSGDVCPLGRSCVVGCNTCACGRDGTLTCTGLACVDAGPPPPVCTIPDGRVCRVGERCRAPDGCNTCTCGRDGSLSCTEIACVDAGTPDVLPPRSCRSTADCPPSMQCDGPLGCEVRWTCVPARGCTADLAPFCGCDGATFFGSSSCPGRPYSARRGCPAADAGAPACAPQDARGEGACDGFFGYAWNGRACVGVSGCRCVGADCATISRDPAACRARYATCG